MLAFVYDQLKSSGFQKIGREDFADAYEMLGKLFLHACKLQLIRGFPHEYRSYSEKTAYPHGQLQLTESISQGTLINKQVIVEDDTYSSDIPENQLVKMVLAGITHADKFPDDQRVLAKKLLRNFWMVKDINQQKYNQQIRPYIERRGSHSKVLVLLAELLADRQVFDPNVDHSRIHEFEHQQMYNLYERFLLKYYQRRFTDFQVSKSDIQWASPTPVGPSWPIMESDVRIFSPEKTVILDAKYYQDPLQEYYSNQTVHSNNIYQILSYVLNESHTTPNSEVEGIVLYAKSGNSPIVNADEVILGHRLRFKTLDLDVEWRLIKQQLDELITF